MLFIVLTCSINTSTTNTTNLSNHLGVCYTFAVWMEYIYFYTYLSTATSFPDGYLTVSALDRLEAMACISIYTQLAPKYLALASTLHLNRSTLTSLRAENNPVEGSKAMFKAWLSEITSFFDKTLVTSPSAFLVSTNILQFAGIQVKKFSFLDI